MPRGGRMAFLARRASCHVRGSLARPTPDALSVAPVLGTLGMRAWLVLVGSRRERSCRASTAGVNWRWRTSPSATSSWSFNGKRQSVHAWWAPTISLGVAV